jgi:thiol:disulfide interchange protein DsbD
MRRFLPILAACVAGAALAAPAATDEPLDPDKAFVPTARLVAEIPAAGSGRERHGIDVEYRIEPGYYLYRSRLKFELAPATVLIGPPEMPPGVEMDDPFLGKSAIFRDRVTIHLPFAVSVAKPGQYRVKITAQGCAEDRICYTPFPQEVVVNIPPGYRVMDLPALDAPPRTPPKGLPR